VGGKPYGWEALIEAQLALSWVAAMPRQGLGGVQVGPIWAPRLPHNQLALSWVAAVAPRLGRAGEEPGWVSLHLLGCCVRQIVITSARFHPATGRPATPCLDLDPQGLAVLAAAGAIVAAVTLGIAKNPADTLQVGADCIGPLDTIDNLLA